MSSARHASLGTVFTGIDLATQAELAALTVDRDNPLVLDPDTIATALDIVRGSRRRGFDAVVAYGDGDDPDLTLLQFNALTGDTERTRQLFTDVDQLWFGDPGQITPIANEILSLEVTDSLTESQGTSILLTILAALIVLLIFFWFTEFRPMLAVLSVLPILLVLVWVLGTMVMLGYDYNVVTALITALSIGIGVDYTIHITHRFLEERETNPTLRPGDGGDDAHHRRRADRVGDHHGPRVRRAGLQPDPADWVSSGCSPPSPSPTH